jgi:hypothetical protein
LKELGRKNLNWIVAQSSHTKETRSGAETTHRGSSYDLHESELAAGRGAHMKAHVAPHEISGPKSALAHTAASRRPALSSGEANGWFMAKDLRS